MEASRERSGRRGFLVGASALTASLVSQAGASAAPRPDDPAASGSIGFVDVEELLRSQEKSPWATKAFEELTSWWEETTRNQQAEKTALERAQGEIEGYEPGSAPRRELEEKWDVERFLVERRKKERELELESRRAAILRTAYERVQAACDVVRARHGHGALLPLPVPPVSRTRDGVLTEIAQQIVISVDRDRLDRTAEVKELLTALDDSATSGPGEKERNLP